jgi:bifunctional DNase/RNase
MIEVNVAGLMVDPSNNAPVVILREVGGGRALPIWIGPVEALAIQSGLESAVSQRPMTHDLLCDVIRRMGGAVEKVEVNDLRDNTFFALVHIDRGGERIAIDSRPSDAIAAAVRFQARIFVDDGVFEKAQVPSPKDDGGGKDKWDELLAGLGPEAFGKYKM